MISNWVFYQEPSSSFPWLYHLLLICNTDFTLQVFQPFCIPFMILQLTPYVSPKTFSILQHLADHHHIFLLLDSIPNKTASDYSETFFLCKSICPFFIPPNFCCNSYNPLLQFFNNNTKCFYSNTVFSF